MKTGSKIRVGLLLGAMVPVAVARAQVTTMSQNFDSVAPPSLPPGWIATNAQGPDPKWVTDATYSDTAPNAVHIDDPTAIADKRLDWPVHVWTPSAQLSFRMAGFGSFHVSYPGTSPSGGMMVDYYDGVVLEISIGGGDFQDILDAGGTLANGFYGYWVLVGQGNPLLGRPFLAGYDPNGGFWGDVAFNLPAQCAGQDVVLRWRMGSSTSVSDAPPIGWWIDSIQVCDGFACDAIPLPKRLDVDTAGNGVLEPGETVDVDPYYYNNGALALDLTGVLNGLGGPTGGEYTIVDGSAVYGSVVPGALGGCLFVGDCYSFSVVQPGPRPAQHWDAQLFEVVSTGAQAAWALHVGESFADVAPSSLFYRDIETVFHRGVTGGCGATNYCPDAAALRKQMAVFLLKSKFGSAYVPPSAVGLFADVPVSNPFAPWIENLYNLGITGGCSASPLRYCPDQTVLRKQMAVFLLKTLDGSGYAPPVCQGIFPDVPCPSPFADWIEALYNQQITGGCGGGSFCPDNPNTRGQMAVFLDKTFGLTLYGP